MATATLSKADEVRLAALKRSHDQLLENMPESSTHDALSCLLCAMDEESIRRPRGGSVGSKTFTDEELADFVADEVKKATASYEEQVEQLKAEKGQTEVEAQVAEAKKPLEDRITELQTELDNATATATTETEKREQVEAWLQAEASAAEEAEAAKARQEERVEKVREIVNFSDEYVESNAERWAAMSEDAFEAALDGIREAASASEGTERLPTSELPRETAFRASAETGSNGKRRTSAVREVMGFRRQGIDARTITR